MPFSCNSGERVARARAIRRILEKARAAAVDFDICVRHGAVGFRGRASLRRRRIAAPGRGGDQRPAGGRAPAASHSGKTENAARAARAVKDRLATFLSHLPITCDFLLPA
jgi:hypothetical protein